MSDAAPDLTRPVLGFRAFVVTPHAHLRSTGVNYIWTPGVNKAECFALTGGYGHVRTIARARALGWVPNDPDVELDDPKHHAPHHECHCGLYALHTAAAMRVHMRGFGFSLNAAGPTVGAVVRASGALEVHMDGFRAERAEICALLAVPGLEPVAELYGVPLVHDAKLEDAEYLAQWGEQVPQSLLPDRLALESYQRHVLGVARGQVASGGTIRLSTMTRPPHVPVVSPPGYTGYARVSLAPPPRFRWWGVGIYLDVGLAAVNYVTFAETGSWFSLGVANFCLGCAAYLTRQWRQRRKRWA